MTHHNNVIGRKDYDVAICTCAEVDAGTTGEVWLKFDGTKDRTEWFPFVDSDAPSDWQHFNAGRIDYGSFDFVDLGELRTCSIQLRGAHNESWLPKSVELIDGSTSYVWLFEEWLTTGEQISKDGPICDESLSFRPSEASVYERCFSEAKVILDQAADRWSNHDVESAESEQVLRQILSIFEGQNLIRR